MVDAILWYMQVMEFLNKMDKVQFWRVLRLMHLLELIEHPSSSCCKRIKFTG